VLRERELLRLNFGVLIIHALLTALFLVVPVALRDAGLPMADHWLVYAPAMVVSFAVLIPVIAMAERRNRVRATFLASITITLAAMSGFALVLDSVIGLALALAAFFIGFNLLEALLPSLVARLAPVHLRGTAIGVYSSIQFMGIFLGGAIGGLLAQAFGLAAVLWFGAALTTAWLAVAAGMQSAVSSGSRSAASTTDAGRGQPPTRSPAGPRTKSSIKHSPRSSSRSSAHSSKA